MGLIQNGLRMISGRNTHEHLLKGVSFGNILRVFREGAWLTVHRPLDISWWFLGKLGATGWVCVVLGIDSSACGSSSRCPGLGFTQVFFKACPSTTSGKVNNLDKSLERNYYSFYNANRHKSFVTCIFPQRHPGTSWVPPWCPQCPLDVSSVTPG